MNNKESLSDKDFGIYNLPSLVTSRCPSDTCPGMWTDIFRLFVVICKDEKHSRTTIPKSGSDKGGEFLVLRKEVNGMKEFQEDKNIHEDKHPDEKSTNKQPIDISRHSDDIFTLRKHNVRGGQI